MIFVKIYSFRAELTEHDKKHFDTIYYFETPLLIKNKSSESQISYT